MRWLTWVLWTPLGGAVVLSLFPKTKHALIRWWALLVSMGAFGLALGILASFRTGEGGFQLLERHRWIPAFGATYTLGVDGISLFLVLLTAFLVPVCVVISWRIDRNPKLFMGLLLGLETAIFGVFLSLDLLMFAVFWDFVLIPMYFLIGYWGYERRIYASIKFFLFTFLGGVLMLVGIITLAFQARSQLGHLSFNYLELQQVHFGIEIQRWLFVAFFAAFAIKVPLFPLHTWLPDAHTEAPTAGSVLLAAVLLKMGTYGFLRYSIPLFPDASRGAVPYVVTLALIGIVYGAIVSAMQRDLKRLVAYSSVSHLGFVVLGIFVFTVTGMQGASLQMVNHGLSTGALFLLVGMLYDRRHTRQIEDFGGLGAVTPIYAGLFLIVALSSLGLPGLNGFVGEFLVLFGAFVRNRAWAVIAVIGVIFAALYLLWAYQRVFHGPVTDPVNRSVPDASARELVVLAPIIALIVFIGVFPRPVLDRMEPSLQRVSNIVRTSPAGAAQTPQAEAP